MEVWRLNIELCSSRMGVPPSLPPSGPQWRSQGGAMEAIAPPFFKNNVIKTFVIDVR